MFVCEYMENSMKIKTEKLADSGWKSRFDYVEVLTAYDPL